jgi:hypothetical protein
MPNSPSARAIPPPLPVRGATTIVAPAPVAPVAPAPEVDPAPPVLSISTSPPAPVDPSAGGDDVAALVRELDDQRGRADAALAALRGAALDPSSLEAAAAQALLAAVDDLLARTGAALDAAPAPAPQLEPARAALVERGVALAGELSQLGAAEAPPRVSRPAPAPQAAARVLSNERPEAVSRGPRGLAILLVIVVVAATGYHGWTRVTRSAPPPLTFANAPANTLGVERGGTRVLTVLPGKRVDPAALERFREAERARGFTVREAGPGTWLVERTEQPKAQEHTP